MSKRIAICDSSPATAAQLEGWLRQYCALYSAEPAILRFATAQGFYEAADACRFDALFFAQDGPEGFLAVRGVRERARELPIVFITDTDSYAVHGFRLHLTDYIVRPVEFRHIVRAMRLLGVGDGGSYGGP